MSFPKPLVILGFILIAAAVAAGIYDEFRNKEVKEEPKVDKKELALKLVEPIFAELFKPLQGNPKVPQEFLDEFKNENIDEGAARIAAAADFLEDKASTGEQSLAPEKELFEEWHAKLKSRLMFKQILTEDEVKDLFQRLDKENK